MTIVGCQAICRSSSTREFGALRSLTSCCTFWQLTSNLTGRRLVPSMLASQRISHKYGVSLAHQNTASNKASCRTVHPLRMPAPDRKMLGSIVSNWSGSSVVLQDVPLCHLQCPPPKPSLFNSNHYTSRGAPATFHIFTLFIAHSFHP